MKLYMIHLKYIKKARKKTTKGKIMPEI